MKNPIRIGIVGAGSIVKSRHITGLRALENIEITAVCNSTHASSEQFCKEFAPEAKALEDWKTLVNLPELDVVWIGTPPYMHERIAVAALRAGKHVFCQARMAMDLKEAQSMLRAAEEHPELVTMLCPPPHGMRWDGVIRELLKNETLGTIHSLYLRSVNSAFADPSAPAHWRQRREISGHQTLTLGIHTEVLNRWFGAVQIVSAQGKVVHRFRNGYEVTLPDFLQVLCTFDKGINGLLELNSVRFGEPEDFLEINGTQGTLRYDYLSDTLFIARSGDTQWKPLNPPEEKAKAWRVEADFINAVRGGERPHPDFNDGLCYMQTVQDVADRLKGTLF